MTINKSQGQTFDKVGIFLSELRFHSLMYVSLSRARKYYDIRVEMIDSERDNRIIWKNIVHNEVLY